MTIGEIRDRVCGIGCAIEDNDMTLAFELQQQLLKDIDYIFKENK